MLNPTIYLCHNKLSHLLRFRNYVFYIWNTMTMEKIIMNVTVTIGNPIFRTLLIVVAIGVSRLSASISSKWSFDDLLKVPRLPLDPFGWNVYWFYKCSIMWKWVFYIIAKVTYLVAIFAINLSSITLINQDVNSNVQSSTANEVK